MLSTEVKINVMRHETISANLDFIKYMFCKQNVNPTQKTSLPGNK